MCLWISSTISMNFLKCPCFDSVDFKWRFLWTNPLVLKCFIIWEDWSGESCWSQSCCSTRASSVRIRSWPCTVCRSILSEHATPHRSSRWQNHAGGSDPEEPYFGLLLLTRSHFPWMHVLFSVFKAGIHYTTCKLWTDFKTLGVITHLATV